MSASSWVCGSSSLWTYFGFSVVASNPTRRPTRPVTTVTYPMVLSFESAGAQFSAIRVAWSVPPSLRADTQLPSPDECDPGQAVAQVPRGARGGGEAEVERAVGRGRDRRRDLDVLAEGSPVRAVAVDAVERDPVDRCGRVGDGVEQDRAAGTGDGDLVAHQRRRDGRRPLELRLDGRRVVGRELPQLRPVCPVERLDHEALLRTEPHGDDHRVAARDHRRGVVGDRAVVAAAGLVVDLHVPVDAVQWLRCDRGRARVLGVRGEGLPRRKRREGVRRGCARGQGGGGGDGREARQDMSEPDPHVK